MKPQSRSRTLVCLGDTPTNLLSLREIGSAHRSHWKEVVWSALQTLVGTPPTPADYVSVSRTSRYTGFQDLVT